MRFVLLCLVLVFWGGAWPERAYADNVSYDVLTPLGQTPSEVFVAPVQAVAVKGSIVLVEVAPEKRAAAVTDALARAGAFARSRGLRVIGPPLVVNHVIAADRWDFEVMLPIADHAAEVGPEVGVAVTQAPSGKAVAMDHHGSNETLFQSYIRLFEGAGVEPLGALTWEQYMTDPSVTPPADQRIRIFRALPQDGTGGRPPNP